MNYKIIVKSLDDKILYKGKLLDIPIKESYVIEKSIEIFDDDDPCIIHKSFVIKKVVDDLLKQTKLKEKLTIRFDEYKDTLHFLDFHETNYLISLGDE